MFSGLEIIFHDKGHARFSFNSESSLVMFERPGTGSEKLIPSLSKEEFNFIWAHKSLPYPPSLGTDTARPSNSIRLT